MSGGDPLEELATMSTHLHPDDVASALRSHSERLGFLDVVVYLADLEQRALHPLPQKGEAVSGRPALAIDGSAAGRAYRTERVVIHSGQAGSDSVEHRAVWMPLLDSAERFGVVYAVVPGDALEEGRLRRWSALVNLAGELIANKATYGDVIVQVRRTRPMSLAAEMRWSMFPPLTFTGRNLTISGIALPPYDVAGDAFDYAINGDTAHVAIIDVVGHGIEAARIANVAVGAYRNGRRAGATIEDIYRAMDEVIAHQFGPERFATTQLASLDLASGRLHWLNAGHPPPMVVRQGHRIDLDADVNLPVGLGATNLAAADALLEPGDIVLFFSDGITEARDESGQQFGRERLADLIEQAAAANQPPAETVRLLSESVLAHQHEVLQDDATLLLLSWAGPSPHAEKRDD